MGESFGAGCSSARLGSSSSHLTRPLDREYCPHLEHPTQRPNSLSQGAKRSFWFSRRETALWGTCICGNLWVTGARLR